MMTSNNKKTDPRKNTKNLFLEDRFKFVGIFATILGLLAVSSRSGFTKGRSDLARQGVLRKLQARGIPMSKVRQHNTADDCWVVFHDQVYDLTNYANRHPNGPADITRLAGKDGTRAFDNEHPISYLAMVSGDVVGELVQEAPVPAPPAPEPVQSPTNNPPPPMVADPVPAPAPKPPTKKGKKKKEEDGSMDDKEKNKKGKKMRH